MKKNFYWRFSRKIEGEFWIFYKRFPCKKNYMEEIFKEISLENWSWGKNFKGDFFNIVDSEVRGTTLQKLIVDTRVGAEPHRRGRLQLS